MRSASQPRYAIYFVPRSQTRLAAFGETLFLTRQPPAFLAGLAGHGWNAGAARYGFHATLKAPFHLRPDRQESDLTTTAPRIASAIPRVQIPRLEVTLVDDFIALTPAQATAELGQLAETCVRGFEPLRAPLTPQDRERRLAAGLIPQEIAYLDTWGYPYVFDGFRFHMTLSGPLAPEHAEPMRRALAQHYEAFDSPVDIDAITICRQPSRDANFDVWQRFELAPRPPAKGEP